MTKQPASLTEPKELDVIDLQVNRTAPKAASIIPFLIVALPFLLFVILQSQSKLLWFDELYTYYIAKAPSLSKLIEQTQTLDLNPPLSYLLVRGLVYLLPASATVCRIPSMLGFLLCMGCVYSYLQRKLGSLWGTGGALFLATGVFYPYAFEARPYGLLLGFLSLGFVGWQKAVSEESNDILSLWLVVCGGLGALLSHVFALPAWIMLISAELVRTYICQRWKWRVLLALLLPLVAIITYIPLFRSHAASYFPVAFQPNVYTIAAFYIAVFAQAIFSVICVMVDARKVLGKNVLKPHGRFPLSPAEWVALLGFLVLPALLMLYLMHLHAAYFFRYGIVASISMAIVPPLLLAWISGARQSVARATVLVLVVWALLPVHRLIPLLPPSLLYPTPKPGECEACALANRIAPDLPFVDASGLTYIEMDNREDSGFLSRVYYLTDPSASLRYAHASIFEGMQKLKDAFPIRSNVEQYSIFVRLHPTFLVLGTYDYPEDWLLKKLQADGAHLCLLKTVGDYQFKDRELWRVTFNTDATAACSN